MHSFCEESWTLKAFSTGLVRWPVRRSGVSDCACPCWTVTQPQAGSSWSCKICARSTSLKSCFEIFLKVLHLRVPGDKIQYGCEVKLPSSKAWPMKSVKPRSRWLESFIITIFSSILFSKLRSRQFTPARFLALSTWYSCTKGRHQGSVKVFWHLWTTFHSHATSNTGTWMELNHHYESWTSWGGLCAQDSHRSTSQCLRGNAKWECRARNSKEIAIWFIIVCIYNIYMYTHMNSLVHRKRKKGWSSKAPEGAKWKVRGPEVSCRRKLSDWIALREPEKLSRLDWVHFLAKHHSLLLSPRCMKIGSKWLKALKCSL